MQYAHVDGTYLITLARGEQVVPSLIAFANEVGVTNGYLSGIGAVDELTCGYYALDEKQYHFTTYTEMIEVVSLSGNLFLKDDAPFFHLHGVFTDTKNQAFGGHIVDMRVGVTLELILTPLASSFTRVPDECIGLSLIDLSKTGKSPR